MSIGAYLVYVLAFTRRRGMYYTPPEILRYINERDKHE